MKLATRQRWRAVGRWMRDAWLIELIGLAVLIAAVLTILDKREPNYVDDGTEIVGD